MDLTVIPKTLHHSPEIVCKCALEYIQCGSQRATSRKTGVAAKTIGEWCTKSWWQDLVGQIRAEKEGELSAKFSELIDIGLSEYSDRLKNGEYQLVSTGNGQEVQRIPMKGKDVVITTSILFDKLRILQNLPTSISSTNNADLKQLQDQFKRLVSARVIEGEAEKDNKNS